MAKHLRVEVNGMEWVNTEFSEISFTDGPSGVRIEGRVANGGGSLLDLITGASKARTQEKRAQLQAEVTAESETA